MKVLILKSSKMSLLTTRHVTLMKRLVTLSAVCTRTLHAIWIILRRNRCQNGQAVNEFQQLVYPIVHLLIHQYRNISSLLLWPIDWRIKTSLETQHACDQVRIEIRVLNINHTMCNLVFS